MNATPFTPNFVGSLGRYPFFDYIDSKSNQNFQYSSNLNFIYSNNSNSTSSNISNLYYNINQGSTNSNISNLYFNTGIIDSNLLWWRYELQGTQLELINQKANQAILSAQQSVLSTTVSAQGFTLAYHTGQINALEPKVANLENNTFSKDQTSNIFVTSNVLSNTSNTLANYNNLYNKPNIYTIDQTSNIFVTSNLLSNTSNTIYNRPDIFTKLETSNIFTTSNHINTNFYSKSQIDTEIKTNLIYIKKVAPLYIDSLIEVSDKFYIRQNSFTNENLVFLKSGTNNYFTLNDNLNTDIKANTSVNITATNNDININATSSIGNIYLSSGNITSNYAVNENLLTSRERVKVSVGSLSSIDRDFNGLICNKGTQGVFLGADLGNLNLSTLTGDIVMVAAGKLKIYGRIEADGNLAKKIPKYFTTSRTANFDGVSCLAYDIDINTLTNFETIDSINFRFFRIKIFFASGVMSYQRTPRSFDISMSNYNTLSISCVENDGYFSELDRASNSSYFLYKQNFNMITVCFPVSLFGSTNIKIAYIIEDLLGK